MLQNLLSLMLFVHASNLLLKLKDETVLNSLHSKKEVEPKNAIHSFHEIIVGCIFSLRGVFYCVNTT